MIKTWEVKLDSNLTGYQAVVTLLDEGVSIVVGGGFSHIGTLILAEPRESLRKDGSYSATSSVMNPVNHLDELPLRKEAERLAARLRTRVTVTGGIHLDEITGQQIKQVLEDCKNLFDEIHASIAREISGKDVAGSMEDRMSVDL